MGHRDGLLTPAQVKSKIKAYRLNQRRMSELFYYDQMKTPEYQSLEIVQARLENDLLPMLTELVSRIEYFMSRVDQGETENGLFEMPAGMIRKILLDGVM